MKHQIKKAEILKAAARVFRLKGYHGTRIQDIADALEMQKGSLYYYISTKEDLLRGLVEDIVEKSVELSDNIRNTEHKPADKVRLCMESHLRLFHENIDAFGVFISENPELINKTSKKDFFGLIKKYEKGWQQLFAEGVKSGDFRSDVDYKIIVKGGPGMLNSTYRWYRINEGYSVEEVAAIFSDMVLKGVKK